MRTDILSYVLTQETRKQIVKTLLEYPNRLWSCSSIEESTKISHATVFRTLNILRDFGILKGTRINKKDVVYELAKESLFLRELEHALTVSKRTVREAAMLFVAQAKSTAIQSIILYGSSVKGSMKPESDIDILVITSGKINSELTDIAAHLSSKIGKTIALTIMTPKECAKEKNSQFIQSLKQNMEVIYGKNPFGTGKTLV